GALNRLMIITNSLENEELNDWIEGELNGYSNSDDIPDYRKNIRYIIRYSGINGSFQVNNNVLPESLFTKEIKEALRSRVITSGIKTIEKAVSGEFNVSFDLIELAPIVYKKSDYMITCMKLEQVIDKTSFLEILSNVKTKLISILLRLEKEFGNLDNLDIDVGLKNDIELENLNDSISKTLYHDGIL
ncbi:AbiTii domain-containing protein, partial [Streptococcus sanguinis]